jgi:hypothetical protein
MLPMWCNLDALVQNSRCLLVILLSGFILTSGQVFWKTEQKTTATHNRNIFLLYMCCTRLIACLKHQLYQMFIDLLKKGKE